MGLLPLIISLAPNLSISLHCSFGRPLLLRLLGFLLLLPLVLLLLLLLFPLLASHFVCSGAGG